MRLPPLVLTGVLVLGLCACTSEEPARTGRDDSEARSKILQPGRPGEDMATLGPDATVEQPATNDADIMFVQMMVPHHAQALEMTELAETRASDEQVVALARRIQGSQGPEITAMAGWLQARDVAVPESMDDLGDLGGHADHGGGHGGHGDRATEMPGMLTERQMARLEGARGAEFDRLFLAGMIRHHQGAVSMARDELGAGSDTLALELAADVALGQQAEIDRMVDLRREL